MGKTCRDELAKYENGEGLVYSGSDAATDVEFDGTVDRKPVADLVNGCRLISLKADRLRGKRWFCICFEYFRESDIKRRWYGSEGEELWKVVISGVTAYYFVCESEGQIDTAKASWLTHANGKEGCSVSSEQANEWLHANGFRRRRKPQLLQKGGLLCT